MCDHCAKVTSQKGYSGQVTCRCERKEVEKRKERKDEDYGCCSKKAREISEGCCKSPCCKRTMNKEIGGFSVTK